jgi:tetratricopeptide (TPR) repeat protein
MQHRSSKPGDEDTQELQGSGTKPASSRAFSRKGADPSRHLRTPEALALLLTLVSLAVLFPLRGILSPVPVLPFLATLVLFLVPGILVSRLIPDDSFSGPGRLPVAFALSTGIYGLAAIPFLVLHRNFDEYLWTCGAILAASLILAAFRVLRGEADEYAAGTQEEGLWSGTMWVPLLAFGAALAYASSRVVPEPNEDHWAYLAYVQEYLDSERLALINPIYGTEFAGFSRLMLNGWLAIQAAFSGISGINPVDLASGYLTPALVLFSLLAFYWLARTLFENESAALFAGALYGLFLLFYMDAAPGSFGGDLVRRALEDKFAARYLMLPVALGLAILYLKKRGWIRLGMFAFVFWATGAVHPMVLGILGLGVAALGAVHLVVNLRDRRAWTGVLALGAVVFLTLIPPTIYLVVTESPLLSKLDTLDPALVQNRLSIWQDQERLLILGEGSYIMHPSLVLNPVIGGAYLLGVPFLIWRVNRSLAAQLLLGVLLFFAALVYFPPVASFAGQFVRPWLIYRLAWPIPLAALLTAAWMAWELLGYASRRFGGTRLLGATPLLALILVVLLASAAAPRALAGIRTMDSVDEAPQENASCVDPAFDWMRETVNDRSVVLAPELENSCVPAYSSLTNVVSYRDQFLGITSGEADLTDQGGSSRKAQAVKDFFGASTVGSAMIETLQRYEVDYVLLPTNSPLNIQLGHLPGFTALDTPGGRYRFYVVNRDELVITQAVVANDALQAEDPYSAIDAYSAALAGDASEAALAYTGLGLAYETLDSPSEAAAAYEEAVARAPEASALYALLSGAYRGAEESFYAIQALQSGIDRIPQDIDLRTELTSLLMSQDAGAAVEVQRQVVERFPEVPSYRIQLGTVLALSGDEAAANRQFETAINLNPLSPELYAEIALANQIAGRDQASLEYYERALELEPDSPHYNLSVGNAYAERAAGEDRNEEYFQRAEEHLTRAAELDPRPGRLDVRAIAWSSLGDLYAGWDRRDQAIQAYEKALKINPELSQTQQRLEELRQSQ